MLEEGYQQGTDYRCCLCLFIVNDILRNSDDSRYLCPFLSQRSVQIVYSPVILSAFQLDDYCEENVHYDFSTHFLENGNSFKWVESNILTQRPCILGIKWPGRPYMTPNSGANLFAINHPSHLHLFALVQRGHIVGQIVRSSPNNLPTLILI